MCSRRVLLLVRNVVSRLASHTPPPPRLPPVPSPPRGKGGGTASSPPRAQPAEPEWATKKKKGGGCLPSQTPRPASSVCVMWLLWAVGALAGEAATPNCTAVVRHVESRLSSLSPEPGRIPWLLHQFAPGAADPEQVALYWDTSLSWSRLYPGWLHLVWSPLQRYCLVQEHEAELALEPAQAPDSLLQYFILLRYGGVYIDAGLEALAPIPELRESSFQALLSLETGGLVAACPGEAILVSILSAQLGELRSRPARPWQKVDLAEVATSTARSALADFLTAHELGTEPGPKEEGRWFLFTSNQTTVRAAVAPMAGAPWSGQANFLLLAQVLFGAGSAGLLLYLALLRCRPRGKAHYARVPSGCELLPQSQEAGSPYCD